MSQNSGQDKGKPSKVRWYWLLVAALLVSGIAASIVVFRDRIAEFQHYGYLGAFIISVLASATVIAFVPSVPVIFALGSVLNPFFVGLTAGIGEAIGEFTGYLAGRSGYAVFIKSRYVDAGKSKGIYPRLQRWVETRGSLALFLSAAVFNPFFSIIGATAGVLRFPPWKFFLVVWAGKTVKWTVVAILGRWLLFYILHWLGITL
jgi:membrane protein YqaA with SNARE-associated domain